MNFEEAVKTVLFKKYATFSGRASRSEFWWFQLFWVGIFVVSNVVFALLFSLIFFLPSMAVTIRRLHDCDLSGWWLLWYYAFMFIGCITPIILLSFGVHQSSAGGGMMIMGIGIFLVLLLLFFSAIVLLVIFCLKGTQGANRFGADPLLPDENVLT